MNVKISIHSCNLEKRKKLVQYFRVPTDVKKDLLKFLDDASLGKVNKGFKISEQRQAKYLSILKIPLEYFNKSVSKIVLKDIENFERDLSSDKILSYCGLPFSLSTKVDIKKSFKIFLKWRVPKKYSLLTSWLDTRIPKKTPDYLSEQEIIKLYKSCKSARERFLIAVLFDSGARAEEFHNIRYEDIQLPKDKENFVKLTLKEEYSKTKGRVISLYWKYSLEAVRDYLDELKHQSMTSQTSIYPLTYDNSRQSLVRMGLRVLNKPIHYHLFRHSSATYYANKLNRQELCYRYGWAFSSDMPDVYISRAGMESKQLDEKFHATENEDLRKRLERAESIIARLEEASLKLYNSKK